MLGNFKVRITALTCASLLSILSIGASPFKISDTPDGGASLNVPEVELDSFSLDGGAAGITEKDIYVEVIEKAAQKETEVTETEPEHWRLYPVDLAVLVVGGGFCTIMIIRERKKAREKL